MQGDAFEREVRKEQVVGDISESRDKYALGY